MILLKENDQRKQLRLNAYQCLERNPSKVIVFLDKAMLDNATILIGKLVLHRV